MSMVTWVRSHGHGHISVVTWTCSHGHARGAMVTRVCSHGCGHMGVFTEASCCKATHWPDKMHLGKGRRHPKILH